MNESGKISFSFRKRQGTKRKNNGLGQAEAVTSNRFKWISMLKWEKINRMKNGELGIQ